MATKHTRTDRYKAAATFVTTATTAQPGVQLLTLNTVIRSCGSTYLSRGKTAWANS